MYCEYTVVHVHLYMKKNTVVVKHKVKHKLYMYTVLEVCKRSIFSRSVYSLSAYSLVSVYCENYYVLSIFRI